jgi:hypothetical protein
MSDGSRGASITALYESMAKASLRSVLLVEYRCPKGCLLLHVWNTPDGRLYYQPRYQLSQSKAETDTVESARMKRTEDGFRVWKSRGGDFDELIDFFEFDPEQGGLSMNCDHVREAVVLSGQLAAHARAATPGRPTRHTVTRNV